VRMLRSSSTRAIVGMGLLSENSVAETASNQRCAA
jgi:hypothetical protein